MTRKGGLVIHRFSSVTSTQDEARRLLEEGRARVGHAIVADEQTGGRGRFGRAWASPRGGLYATFATSERPLLSLASGMAVVNALDEFNVHASLKWPNDIVLGEAKLAGVLIEIHHGTALVGIGVNLEVGPVGMSTSTRTIGAVVRRGDLLRSIWRELQRDEDPKALLSAYRKRSATLGRRVRILIGEGGQAVEGIAVAVDGQGRLVVETCAGRRTITSGECQHLRVLQT